MLVPARYRSQRFPGKPLTPIVGAGGTPRPLVVRSWQAATASGFPSWVLTDDERIADCAALAGAKVLMTPERCANGTERCAAALGDLAEDTEILVNLQGDSPLVPHGLIAHLVSELRARPAAAMVTPVFAAPTVVRQRLIEDWSAGRVGGTNAVFGAGGRALYFSKRPLPYGVEADETLPLHLHIGIYAYRRAALAAYPGLPASPLELAEGLEQLRFLENGLRVDVVTIPPVPDFWEVNNPGDVPIVERALAMRGTE